MNKMIGAVAVFVFISAIAVCGFAQDQLSDSESSSESSMSSSLDNTIAGEEAEGKQNMQEMDSSMQGNETATQTY